MSRVVLVRMLLAVIGVIVWGYGYRYNEPNIRLAAIAVLAVTLLLRFTPGGRPWPRRRRGADSPDSTG
jgi:hypothetical protein